MPTYNYNLSASVVIQTVVSSYGGGTNNAAIINIQVSGTTNWTGTMIQASPTITTPKLNLGNSTIDAGGTFQLTEPSALQNGNVVANLVFTAPPSPPQPFNGQVSSWTLSST